MRATFLIPVFAAVALAHGERFQSPSGPPFPTTVVPTGGPTDPRTGPRGGSPAATRPEAGTLDDWTIWWAYHEELFLAARLRGTPTTKGDRKDNGAMSRKELRERLAPVLLGALSDKNHDVRAAAAIALGKLRRKEAQDPLWRRTDSGLEKWFDVRESSLYGVGLLGLEEDRGLLRSAAHDKRRSIKERGLSLVGLLADGTEASREELVALVRAGPDRKFRPGGGAWTGAEELRRVATHLLGFTAEQDDASNALLWDVATNEDGWGAGPSGLAVTALGRRKARTYLPGLLRLVRARSTNKDVKRSVAVALGLMLRADDEAGIAELGRLLREKRDPVLAHFAVMALARIGGERATGLLLSALYDRVFPAVDDRKFLYLALGIVGKSSEDARDALWSAYQDSGAADVRAVQALGLGLAHDRRMVDLTCARLKKTSLEGGAQFLAYGTLGLGFCGAETAVPEVREVFRKYGHTLVRRDAAMALLLLQRSKAVGTLVGIVRDSGALSEKAAGVIALGLLPDPSKEAVDALLAVLGDKNAPQPARAAAVIALGAMADDANPPFSAVLVSGYDYYIRSLALDEIATYL